jgi:hypothetical protein
VWATVGLFSSILWRHVRKLALINVLVLASLCLGLGINRLYRSPAARTLIRSKLAVSSSQLLDTDCWREAAVLVINGLSLFNGNVPAYSKYMEITSQKLLIRKQALHFYFLNFL